VRRLLVTVLLLVLVVAGAAGAFAWNRIESFRQTPFGGPGERVVTVPSGASARSVVRLLAREDVVSDEATAWWYLRVVRRDPRPFRAGEYAFRGALRPDDVFERVRRGEVKLYQFTVPEGLRLEEVATIVDASGLARGEDILRLARDTEVSRSLGVPFANLEGYLYPDTYTFAKGVSARAIVQAMVKRFKDEYAKADAARAREIALTEAEAATLASIIEKETGRPEERARISCVFHNRLKRGMRLQTDPTVMYATMLRTGRWSRNISRADLLSPHPYNTYTSDGLPPGPIAGPGAEALRAALAPAACNDLYFVSRNDGSHVFCPDLACHAAAVRSWQVEFFRQKRSAR
jgi:UPF0755 protein